MKRTVKSRIDTDWTMKELFRCLLSDSRAAVGFQIAPDLSRLSTAEARAYVFPSMFCWNDPYLLKWHYQLASLWQRYRFSDEPLNDKQLDEVTMEKFRNNLDRVAAITLDHPLVSSVLRKAREICCRIVGDFSEDDLNKVCKFGSRSTVGNPLAKAYLDLKLAGPITGSCSQLNWFYGEYLKSDLLLLEIIEKSEIQKVEYLKVVPVPKSWKIKRSILANTLIGNFHSAGLGQLLVDALKSEGLDIRRLQEVHRRLVKLLSVTRTHATGDLSLASDSIIRLLVKALLPNTWVEAMDIDHFPLIDVDGKVMKNPCYCTMGIGFTFPLQTLIFYSLLSAIKELAGCTKGFISVYGDDLIYPRSLHRHVEIIFPLLGFILNKDKTYAEEYFRESCGADFYRGVDVRPFKPMATCERLNKHNYSRFIYKLINGLLERWDKVEIPQTLYFLYKELANSTMEILVVPPSFPATAGIKCESPCPRLPNFAQLPKWRWNRKEKTVMWCFARLSDQDDSRTVRRQMPYYWLNLRRQQELQEPVRNYGPATPELLRIMASYYKRMFHEEEHGRNPSYYGESREVLRWIRHRENGKLIPYVTRKAEKQAVRTTAHVHTWK